MLCGGRAAWLWLQLQSLWGMVFIDTCPSDGDHCCYWHSNTHIKGEGTRVVCSSSYADSIPNLPYFGFKISVLAVQLRNLGLVLAGRGEDCKWVLLSPCCTRSSLEEKKPCHLFSNFLKLLSFCNCPFSISSLLFQLLLVMSHLPFLLLYFFLLLKRFFSSSICCYFLLPVPSPSSLPLPRNTVSDIFKHFSSLTVWTVKIEDSLGVGNHVLNCKLACR